MEIDDGKPWVKVQDIAAEDCDAWLEEDAATADIRMVVARGDERHVISPAKTMEMLKADAFIIFDSED